MRTKIVEIGIPVRITKLLFVYRQNALQGLLSTLTVTFVSFVTSFTVYFSSMYSRCDLSTGIYYTNIWIKKCCVFASAFLAIQTAVIATGCLSVRLFVTFRCFIQTNEDTIMRFSTSGRAIILGGKLVLITNRKLHISFRLVPKSVTLNDLERRNGPYFALFYRIR